MGNNTRALGVIPARWASSRYPGKPLSPLCGKPLIQWTYENARRCHTLHNVVVATDDKRIFDTVATFGGNAAMTSAHCPTGTDRLVDLLNKNTHYQNYDIIVNIQGDEPCLSPEIISKLITILTSDKDACMATAASPFHSPEDLQDKNKVKCIIDRQANALFFSRIKPVAHDIDIHTAPIYHHMGIYAFRRDFLMTYSTLPETPLQNGENLEQLKVMEHGHRIKVAIVNERAFGVDTPEDAKEVEQWLKTQNSYSSQEASFPL